MEPSRRHRGKPVGSSRFWKPTWTCSRLLGQVRETDCWFRRPRGMSWAALVVD